MNARLSSDTTPSSAMAPASAPAASASVEGRGIAHLGQVEASLLDDISGLFLRFSLVQSLAYAAVIGLGIATSKLVSVAVGAEVLIVGLLLGNVATDRAMIRATASATELTQAQARQLLKATYKDPAAYTAAPVLVFGGTRRRNALMRRIVDKALKRILPPAPTHPPEPADQ